MQIRLPRTLLNPLHLHFGRENGYIHKGSRSPRLPAPRGLAPGKCPGIPLVLTRLVVVASTACGGYTAGFHK